MIRKSTIKDKKKIKELLNICFGETKTRKALHKIEGRYYLYFIDDKLVALSGLYTDSEFPGLEIDYTCTHPDYRHKGIMQELFRTMLKDVNQDLYCSCWRLCGKDRINLKTIMELFDFKEVINTRIHYVTPHNCWYSSKEHCTYCTGENCECFEDLYLRKLPSYASKPV